MENCIIFERIKNIVMHPAGEMSRISLKIYLRIEGPEAEGQL